MPTADDLSIPSLGPCRADSPLCKHCRDVETCTDSCRETIFVPPEQRVLMNDCPAELAKQWDGKVADLPAFEVAGPRRKIYFDASKVRAGIVTCGGLCPGLNDVIRGLVMELHYRYGVGTILGFRYGYEGFISRYGHEVMELTPDRVAHINDDGGTILGSSRGKQDYGEIVDCLERMGVSMLFPIGGDGTQRGAMHLAEEIDRRGLKVAIVGIPKTIDNDILYIDQSFGFETAFSEAFKAVTCAHTEAEGAFNGVGLVKLMGRESGFIACNTALATGVANLVLIPEIPFALDGPGGVLAFLKDRLQRRRHACVVVAEGAGQELMDGTTGTDASGNTKLKDIGPFLKERISAFVQEQHMPHTVKYIDPSYIIRSVPATPKDSLYCLRLAQVAVHAAMAGRTTMVVGQWRNRFVHFPMSLITQGRKHIDPHGDLWRSVLEATGQPAVLQ